ncbi:MULTISPECIES: hypothetical protein [unclassified Lysinibacillus]|uniref:hypothetical protein n=1 Tax=unclassified Lysinibacillus TaxID=2636778 RepID=UPI0030F9940D
MDEYIILMLNGSVPVRVSGVNLKSLEIIINKPESFAVRIGKKSMVKNLIAAVVKKEAIAGADDRNLKVVVRDAVTDISFFTSAQSDAILDSLTNDINKKAFALVGDEILINRSCYQYAEFSDRITESDDKEGEKSHIVGGDETQADA